MNIHLMHKLQKKYQLTEECVLALANEGIETPAQVKQADVAVLQKIVESPASLALMLASRKG